MVSRQPNCSCPEELEVLGLPDAVKACEEASKAKGEEAFPGEFGGNVGRRGWCQSWQGSRHCLGFRNGPNQVNYGHIQALFRTEVFKLEGLKFVSSGSLSLKAKKLNSFY